MDKQRIIFWGHKLYSHSHSFIFGGFKKAFEYLEYETFWFDNDDDVSNFDFSDCVIFTEGQVCQKMPHRKDCIYILHNCSPDDYKGKVINVQYYHKDCLKYEHIAHGIAKVDNCLLFPWGSPLLPHEFDFDNVTRNKSNDIYFLGTVHSPNSGGNFEQILDFAKSAKAHGRNTIVGGGYTGRIRNENLQYIQGWISEDLQNEYYCKAYMAPALQGKNQLDNCMIPCRLFKAISWGGDGITNNPLAYDFFKGAVVYSEDTEGIYYVAEAKKNEIARKKWLMNFVKENHTYLNNIKTIMQAI